MGDSAGGFLPWQATSGATWVERFQQASDCSVRTVFEVSLAMT